MCIRDRPTEAAATTTTTTTTNNAVDTRTRTTPATAAAAISPSSAFSVLEEICTAIKRSGGGRPPGGGIGVGVGAFDHRPTDFGSSKSAGNSFGDNLNNADASSSAPPPAVEAELKSGAAMAVELLKHFWAATPMVTPPRWDKAFRVNAALGTLYDRLDGCKKDLTPSARHAVAGRLRPLMQAMDSAFAFYDDEKIRRSSAYEAYERYKETAKKGGNAREPIELS